MHRAAGFPALASIHCVSVLFLAEAVDITQQEGEGRKKTRAKLQFEYTLLQNQHTDVYKCAKKGGDREWV